MCVDHSIVDHLARKKKCSCDKVCVDLYGYSTKK